MNSKIIFWINDSLSVLGLPKILQEKYNFDIFGVFDITDKPKKFNHLVNLFFLMMSNLKKIALITEIKLELKMVQLG